MAQNNLTINFKLMPITFWGDIFKSNGLSNLILDLPFKPTEEILFLPRTRKIINIYSL